MEKVTIFTDGAARGNPGPAGWGVVIVVGDEVVERGDRKQSGTNNEAELAAVLSAVAWVAEQPFAVDVVDIYSDSSYTISGADKWLAGWKRRGWQTKDDEDIANKSLWQHWDRLVSQVDFEINFHKVKGHAGIPANERADAIATGFADDNDVELFRGSKDDYDISLEPQPTRLDNAPIYLSLVDDEVCQHTSWEDCQARVSGQPAEYKKVYTEIDKAETLKKWGVDPDGFE